MSTDTVLISAFAALTFSLYAINYAWGRLHKSKEEEPEEEVKTVGDIWGV